MIDRFRIKIIFSITVSINIYCFLTKKFVATKKFEKRNILAGFRQLCFPTWVPNTRDF